MSSFHVSRPEAGAGGSCPAVNMQIGMVAGEPSGDLLAAQVMAGLQARDATLCFAGIGGPRMQHQGLNTWYPMDALSVFGYVDALKRLPALVAMRRDVQRRWLTQPPAVFVGVDAPDFNLGLEANLRQRGIPTVHFVGPSIWAWRGERIHAIRRAVSHMLVVFPFEEQLYRDADVPVTYVGHPLASVIPMQPDKLAARASLNLNADAKIVALMPGSRSTEIQRLGPRFIQAAELLRGRDRHLQFVAPMVNEARRQQFQALLQRYPLPGLQVISGQAYDVMTACDAVMVASGTASLEAALFKRPMVIAYAVSPLALWIMRRRSGQQRPYLPWVGLPNVLAREFLVPEFLQDAATPQAIADALWPMLEDAELVRSLQLRFVQMHNALQRDTAGLAAQAIMEVAQRG